MSSLGDDFDQLENDNIVYRNGYQPTVVGSLGSSADVGSGFEPDPPNLNDELDNGLDDDDDDLEEVSCPFQNDESFDSVLDTRSDSCETLIQTPSVSNGKTGTAYTVFLIINAALGAGLLNFPKSFDEAGGVLTAVIVQAILLIFILSALLILAQTADRYGAQTLQGAMEGAAGNFGKYLTSSIVAIYCFGTTVTFLIIIGDQFDRVLGSWIGPNFSQTWYLNRTFTLSISSLVFILPLCFSKKIDFLKLPSALGVLAIFYIVGLIIYEYYFGNYTPGPIKTKPDNWTDVFMVVPEICFGYQCHVSVIPIYSCMKSRTLSSFTKASFLAVAVCCFCYTGAAAWGYYTFGSFVKDDILSSYGSADASILIANVAMAVKTFTTYPILLYCGREALTTLLTNQSTHNDLSRYIISSIWFISSLLVALYIPSITIVIKALGSLAAVIIFIFPGICLLRSANDSDPSFIRKKTTGYVTLAILLHVIGFFLFGVVITDVIKRPSHLSLFYL